MYSIIFSLLLSSTIIFAPNARATEYPHSVTPKEVSEWITEGSAVLIDVREQSEVSQGMAQPANWYAKSSIDRDFPAFLKYLSQFSGKKVVLYCRSGHRASIVIEALNASKKEAYNMGGYAAWVDAGLPTKKP